MKRHLTAAAAITVLSALTLSGCSANGIQKAFGTPAPQDTTIQEPEVRDSYYLEEGQITLKDGRVVTCVEYNDVKAGGVSCDWDSANGLVPDPAE